MEEEGLIERCGRRHITSSVNSWSMDCAPIVGMVACGQPITAIENIQGYLPINKEYFGEGDYMALIAEGNSMVNVGIDNGDLVVIRRLCPENDEMEDIIVNKIEILGVAVKVLKDLK